MSELCCSHGTTTAQRKTLLKSQPSGTQPSCALEEQEMSSEGSAPPEVFVAHLHRHLRVASAERRSCKPQQSWQCTDYGWIFGDWETPTGNQTMDLKNISIAPWCPANTLKRKEYVHFHDHPMLIFPPIFLCSFKVDIDFFFFDHTRFRWCLFLSCSSACSYTVPLCTGVVLCTFPCTCTFCRAYHHPPVLHRGVCMSSLGFSKVRFLTI